MPSLSPLSIILDKTGSSLTGHTPQGQDALPPLSVGETVEVSIIGNVDNTTVLAELKGKKVTASTPGNYRPGDRLAARVDQVSPRIILRLTGDQSPAAAAAMNRSIGAHRVNFLALADSLVHLKTLLADSNPWALHYRGTDEGSKVLSMLSSLLLSDVSSPGSFFRNYLQMLGISLEHRLGKACGKMFGRTRAIRKAADNLKGLLVRIMAKGRSDAGGTDHHGMKGFISAADRVVSCIEALQIINASLLEREQACLFQIPVALYEGGTGVAEVFVKREDRGEGNEGSKKGWTLHCLLTMDALGDIAVDARFEKKTVACSISCGDEATGAFIHGHMEELRERLVHAGYHVGAMGCVIKADRREERDAWLRLLDDNDHPGVNVVA